VTASQVEKACEEYSRDEYKQQTDSQQTAFQYVGNIDDTYHLTVESITSLLTDHHILHRQTDRQTHRIHRIQSSEH